jgi:hypothetical protein
MLSLQVTDSAMPSTAPPQVVMLMVASVGPFQTSSTSNVVSVVQSFGSGAAVVFLAVARPTKTTALPAKCCSSVTPAGHDARIVGRRQRDAEQGEERDVNQPVGHQGSFLPAQPKQPDFRGFLPCRK